MLSEIKYASNQSYLSKYDSIKIESIIDIIFRDTASIFTAVLQKYKYNPSTTFISFCLALFGLLWIIILIHCNGARESEKIQNHLFSAAKQIVPLLEHFRFQIIINKRTNAVQFEDIAKLFEFNGTYTIKYASVILGVLQIEGDFFLLYVEEVYLQHALPPDQTSIYQIASINFLQYGRYVSNRQREIFETLKTQIFNFGFYFSFNRDLTVSFQKWRTQLRPKPRDIFFWNEGMLKAMNVDLATAQWMIPVIQGHYGRFQLSLGNRMISCYLISRRSKYRSGTRFYNRGIDQNAKCAQFIETEQIIVIGNEIISLVCLSGSPPIFWQQKSQNDKIRLTRNKQLTALPLVQHLSNIKNDYGRVLLINLLQRKKQGENLLTTALQQLIHENEAKLQNFCRYVYFDLNDACKNKAVGEVFQILNKMDPVIKQFGFFKWDFMKNQRSSMQRGVIRVSCLDCLSRTNRFMQAFFFYQLSEQLIHQKVINEHLTSTRISQLINDEEQQMTSLMLGFKILWEEKADFESMIYAGSRATNGRKNKFLDELQDSLISLQRLYNQKFMDEIKQKSLDLILYHKNYRMDSVLKNKENIELHICIVTWNVNATDPQKLKQLQKVIEACEGADLVIFGIQEMIELSTNNVVSNNEEESKVSMKWGKILQKYLNNGKDKKIFVQKVEMVGLMQIAFISDNWKHAIKAVQKDTVKTGVGGQFGNKGAVALRLKIYETTLCFTCAHLTAGFSKAKERVEDLVQIHKKCFQQSKEGVQNEAEIEESDYKFFFGDLNFRIQGEYKDIKAKLEAVQGDPESKKVVVSELIEHDQLTKICKEPGIPYQLQSYEEPKINFLPTYKLDKHNGTYTEQRNRNPSWCDRILFWGSNHPDHSCECLGYKDINVVGSDHRPVVGRFRVIVNQAIRLSTFIKYDLIS